VACTITITSVVGDSPLTTVHVAGTVTVGGCASVSVTLECTPGTGSTVVVPVDALGNWAADFTSLAGLGCACSKPFVVHAKCTDADCTPAVTKGPLPCPPPGCPTAMVTVTDLGCVAPPNGLRTIRLDAVISGMGSIVTEWDFGDGTSATASPLLVYSVTHAYATPGPFTATLNVILPTGCPPAAVVTVGPLDRCPTNCPDATVAVNVVGCAGAGGAVAVATFAVTLVPPTSGCTFHWNFGDGGTAVTTVPSAAHTYATPGTYAVSVAVVCGATCVTSAGVTTVVPSCCPTILSVSGTVSGCVDSDSTATVTWVATTDPPASPGTFFWDYSDGVTATTTAPTHTRVYNSTGTKAVDVAYTSPIPICPPTSASGAVSVPACGDGGGGSTACGVSTIIIAILTALVLGAVIIGAVATFCLGLPLPGWYWGLVAGFAIAIGVIIGLTYLLCAIGWCPCLNRCDWLKIAWIAAVAAAVIALYFGGCCGGWWWAIIVGLFASAGVALKAWRDNCHPSTCEVVLTLVVALATVAGMLFGFIQTLGPLTAVLTACAWLWVKVATAALAGVLAAWAAANCSGP
jgi:hypothetical protein